MIWPLQYYKICCLCSRESSTQPLAEAPAGDPSTGTANFSKTADPTSTQEKDEVQRATTGEEGEEGPQETEEERRERVEVELVRLREELKETGSCVSLQPLGFDRHHHRYWLFPNLPGLYVEDLGLSEETSPSSSLTSTDVQMEASPTPRPPSPPSQPVKGSPRQPVDERGRVRWYCYTSEEEVEELLAALDVRGVREKALQEALTVHKSALISSLHKAEQKSRLRPSPTNSQAYSSGDQYLELYLREQILDTEEKIHLGNLGHLRGTGGRDQWRDEIENSGAAAELNAWREKKELGGGGEGGGEGGGGGETREEREGKEGEVGETKEKEASRPSSVSPASRVNASTQALSQALLEVEAGIEQKFLMPPLGMAVDSKQSRLRSSKKEVVKETDVCREQWRASLSQATSFSQIFVHLSTLERAIMWSRSLMNVRCRICRRKGGDEYMLLCDGCDHGYHTYCLKPPLEQVPEGDWFCRDCAPITPVKPRKRTQRVVFQEVGIRLFTACFTTSHNMYLIPSLAREH